ncbi:DUF4426 domain-containing protein [Congregibacter brevis]|uniref:DUF4426 domain-containing protein n=1 Tax=Congregibacter brevis TaxID=3081201 RepID=A0ABZ0ID99_9GAMM|nr:DUF4426 domain-containing protein [Congregibacter sp. IMCC45268]
MNKQRRPHLGWLSSFVMLCLFVVAPVQAQLSERFGDYELHYSVVNTTFIEPEIAAQYGLARGSRRAIINLSLREHLEDGSTVAREMDLDGRSWDLTQAQVNFDFVEVREGPAIYYIGEFKFINREWRFFEFDFTPSGSDEVLNFEFKQQMYIND